MGQNEEVGQEPGDCMQVIVVNVAPSVPTGSEDRRHSREFNTE